MQIQSVLKSIGFPTDIVRRVSVCAYEAEMNTVPETQMPVRRAGDVEFQRRVEGAGIVIGRSKEGHNWLAFRNRDIASRKRWSQADKPPDDVAGRHGRVTLNCSHYWGKGTHGTD